jgi:hypothetical protein
MHLRLLIIDSIVDVLVSDKIRVSTILKVGHQENNVSDLSLIVYNCDYRSANVEFITRINGETRVVVAREMDPINTNYDKESLLKACGIDPNIVRGIRLISHILRLLKGGLINFAFTDTVEQIKGNIACDYTMSTIYAHKGVDIVIKFVLENGTSIIAIPALNCVLSDVKNDKTWTAKI